MITKQLVVCSVVCLSLVSNALAQEQSITATIDSSKPLTRAEVIADLRLWQRAGLRQFDTPYLQDVYTEAYQKALDRYVKLRSGPEFLEEVLRVISEAE